MPDLNRSLVLFNEAADGGGRSHDRRRIPGGLEALFDVGGRDGLPGYRVRLTTMKPAKPCPAVVPHNEVATSEGDHADTGDAVYRFLCDGVTVVPVVQPPTVPPALV